VEWRAAVRILALEPGVRVELFLRRAYPDHEIPCFSRVPCPDFIAEIEDEINS
jgi:hypothetical protein